MQTYELLGGRRQHDMLWNMTLYVTWHFMQHSIISNMALYVTLQCMQYGIVCNIALYATWHCMEHNICNMALYATWHCMQHGIEHSMAFSAKWHCMQHGIECNIAQITSLVLLFWPQSEKKNRIMKRWNPCLQNRQNKRPSFKLAEWGVKIQAG